VAAITLKWVGERLPMGAWGVRPLFSREAAEGAEVLVRRASAACSILGNHPGPVGAGFFCQPFFCQKSTSAATGIRHSPVPARRVRLRH
jgi:hypothetical protein